MATVSLSSSAGRWIMVSSILASAMAFIDGTALNVTLPALQTDLNASSSGLFWILNAYLMMLAALILTGGTLGDNIGRKKVFMTGIAVFIAGSVACGFAPGVMWLIIFRALQGLGGALMIPGSLSIISSSIHEKERGRAIGTWSAATTIVTLGGPLLGGALADAGLWRYIFFINVPIGIIALLVLQFRAKIPEEIRSGQPLDYPGAVTIALSLAALTFGFLRIPDVGLMHWQTFMSLGGGALLLGAFVCIEYKSPHPMMPLQLFRNATFSGANLLTFFLYAGLGGGMLFLSLNLVQVQGYSQFQSGLTFLPFTLLMIVMARVAGRLADEHGPRMFLIGGPATAAAGLLLLSFVGKTAGPPAYWTTFFPGIFTFGLGMSFTVAPLTTAVMGAVSAHFSGAASGVNNAMTRVASVFANAIFGGLAVLFFSGNLEKVSSQMAIPAAAKHAMLRESRNLGDAHLPPGLTGAQQLKVREGYRQSFIHAYATIMRICAVLALVGAFMGLFFIKTQIHAGAAKSVPGPD